MFKQWDKVTAATECMSGRSTLTITPMAALPEAEPRVASRISSMMGWFSRRSARMMPACGKSKEHLNPHGYRIGIVYT
jgi:hypothetical protein